jgi:hypothetical protein
LPALVDSGLSAASTRFSAVRRRRRGERAPDGRAPLWLPAVAAMLACVRSPLPTASSTRRAWSGAGNSAMRAESGMLNSGEAGSAHSVSMNVRAGVPGFAAYGVHQRCLRLSTHMDENILLATGA